MTSSVVLVLEHTMVDGAGGGSLQRQELTLPLSCLDATSTLATYNAGQLPCLGPEQRFVDSSVSISSGTVQMQPLPQMEMPRSVAGSLRQCKGRIYCRATALRRAMTATASRVDVDHCLGRLSSWAESETADASMGSDGAKHGACCQSRVRRAWYEVRLRLRGVAGTSLVTVLAPTTIGVARCGTSRHCGSAHGGPHTIRRSKLRHQRNRRVRNSAVPPPAQYRARSQLAPQWQLCKIAASRQAGDEASTATATRADTSTFTRPNTAPETMLSKVVAQGQGWGLGRVFGGSGVLQRIWNISLGGTSDTAMVSTNERSGRVSPPVSATAVLAKDGRNAANEFNVELLGLVLRLPGQHKGVSLDKCGVHQVKSGGLSEPESEGRIESAAILQSQLGDASQKVEQARHSLQLIQEKSNALEHKTHALRGALNEAVSHAQKVRGQHLQCQLLTARARLASARGQLAAERSRTAARQDQDSTNTDNSAMQQLQQTQKAQGAALETLCADRKLDEQALTAVDTYMRNRVEQQGQEHSQRYAQLQTQIQALRHARSEAGAEGAHSDAARDINHRHGFQHRMQTQAQQQVERNQEPTRGTPAKCLRPEGLATPEGRRCLQTLLRSAKLRFHAVQITSFHRWRLFAAGERFELLEEHMHAARDEQSMVDGIRRLELALRVAARRRALAAFRRWHRECAQLAASEWAREVAAARAAAEHSMHLAVQRLLMQRLEGGADCLVRAMRLCSMRSLRAAWRVLERGRWEKRPAALRGVCVADDFTRHERSGRTGARFGLSSAAALTRMALAQGVKAHVERKVSVPCGSDRDDGGRTGACSGMSSATALTRMALAQGVKAHVERKLFASYSSDREQQSLHGPSIMATGVLGPPGAPSTPHVPRFFSLHTLQSPAEQLPRGVDAAHRESYLRADDFKELFGIDKNAFDALPKWKRTVLKKRMGLF